MNVKPEEITGNRLLPFLSVRTRNCVEMRLCPKKRDWSDITVRDILEIPPSEWLRVRNFGQRSANELFGMILGLGVPVERVPYFLVLPSLGGKLRRVDSALMTAKAELQAKIAKMEQSFSNGVLLWKKCRETEPEISGCYLVACVIHADPWKYSELRFCKWVDGVSGANGERGWKIRQLSAGRVVPVYWCKAPAIPNDILDEFDRVETG